MRLMLKSMIVMLVIAGIAPFVLPLKDGQPLLRWSDLRLPTAKLPELPSGPAAPAEPVTLYRWRGPDGALHLSDTAPPADTPFETLHMAPEINTVEAVQPTPSAPAKAETPSTPSVLDAYNPANVKSMIDQARDMQRVLDERAAAQEQALQR